MKAGIVIIVIGLVLFGCITQETVEGPKDCGNDMDCFIAEAENCSNASMEYSQMLPIFGVEITSVTMLSLEAQEDKCILHLKTKDIQVRYSNELKQQMKSMNMTDEQIAEAEVNASKNAQGTKYDDKCIFEKEDLTSMLTRWNEGSFSTSDFSNAECSGEVFGEPEEEVPCTKNSDCGPGGLCNLANNKCLVVGEEEPEEQVEEEPEETVQEEPEEIPEEQIEEEPEEVCNDPDGMDILSIGTTSKGEISYTDTCNQLEIVKEYYCKENEIDSMLKQCPTDYRCDQGRCVEIEKVCEDSDGLSAVTRGTVTITSVKSDIEFEDKCEDEFSVNEYYCEDGESKSMLMDCPEETFCTDGYCKEGWCEDSDGGFDITTTGIVKKGNTEYEDYCLGSTSGMEYYCDGDNVEKDPFSCPSGEECKSGRCR